MEAFYLLELWKEFGFSSHINKKQLEAFKQGNDFIWFRFLKDGADSFVAMDCKGQEWRQRWGGIVAIVLVSDDSLAYGEDGGEREN